ncbi:MAG: DUF1232 domain-containing protein [Victivallaceae bacterium]|nr:DUF1232 domain-containing protein [Victivallaceae bacterium]
MITQEKKRQVAAALESGAQNISPEIVRELAGQDAKVRPLWEKLGGGCEKYRTLWAILQDFARDVSCRVPWELVAAAAAAFAYLIFPFDVIPDFIPVSGYADDVFMLELVLERFAVAITSYEKRKNDTKIPF